LGNHYLRRHDLRIRMAYINRHCIARSDRGHADSRIIRQYRYTVGDIPLHTRVGDDTPLQHRHGNRVKKDQNFRFRRYFTFGFFS